MLSTQSDIQTTLDAEPLPSSGSQALAEKATSKMLRAASKTEHADKSDVFEAPSFMTLVEPRDGIDQKAAASETQTTQNPNSVFFNFFIIKTEPNRTESGRFLICSVRFRFVFKKKIRFGYFF